MQVATSYNTAVSEIGIQNTPPDHRRAKSHFIKFIH